MSETAVSRFIESRREQIFPKLAASQIADI